MKYCSVWDFLTITFGDDWEHELTIEESRYFNPELRSEIECLDGAGACPPEDIGGVPGYYEFCNALKDPDHEGYGSLVEWAAGAMTVKNSTLMR